jgi:hypothetical protein
LNFVPESSKKIKYLALDEEDFWKWLIETYLYSGEKPDGSAEEEETRLKEQEKVKEELKELRLKHLVSIAIYFMSSHNFRNV